jgi:branched-chain amino acid transport system ATP-binding protein
MLEVTGVAAAYGQAQALWDVSLRVAEGEIVTIVGPNGAGKSTLVNVLGGLHTASAGSIVLDGRDLSAVPSHQVCAAGLAVVPEGRRVFPNMTVRDNLDVGAYHRAAREVHDETYEEVVEIFPRLADRASQLAGSLSGGEQQMLAVGRAVSRPRTGDRRADLRRRPADQRGGDVGAPRRTERGRRARTRTPGVRTRGRADHP